MCKHKMMQFVLHLYLSFHLSFPQECINFTKLDQDRVSEESCEFWRSLLCSSHYIITYHFGWLVKYLRYDTHESYNSPIKTKTFVCLFAD